LRLQTEGQHYTDKDVITGLHTLDLDVLRESNNEEV
jgi:hypothetical protein